MTWPQRVFVELLLTSALLVAWKKYSITVGALRRFAEVYLWLAPVLWAGVLGPIHDLGGLKTFVPAAAVYLATIAWALRAHAPAAQPSWARASGVLLILGAAVVWLGADTWPGMALPKIAAHLPDHLFTVGGFSVGSLLSLAGFSILRAHLRDQDDALLSQLGLVALLIANVCWLLHLAFRATVMVAVANQSAAAPPDWYQPLRMWSGAMYAGYMVLAYLSIAAFGAAMRKTGWASERWGRALVGFGLVAALGFAGRMDFDMPLMVQFMPYAMGMILLRRATTAERAGKPAVAGAAV